MAIISPFANILVAYDGSPPADAALGLALATAERHDGRVVVVHASSGPVPAVLDVETACDLRPGRTGQIRALDATRRELFRTVGARARNASVPVTLEFSGHGAVAAVLDAAARWDVTAIAVGTHSRTGIARALVGSVAEDVVRFARIPVLIAHEATPTRAFGRIAVAVDATACSQHAVSFAIALAQSEGADLVFCCVVDTSTIARPIADMPFDPTALIAQCREAACSVVEVAAGRARAEGLVAITEVTDASEPGAGIVEIARRHDAQLIVVGTQARNNLERLLAGNAATSVMRRSSICVLIAPDRTMANASSERPAEMAR